MRQMQSPNAPKTPLEIAFLNAGVKLEPPQERATAEPETIPTPLVESASTPVEQSADKIPTPPAERLVESLPERPDTPLEMMDPSLLMTGAHVEVTSRLPTPPLMTRCNKSTQAYSSHLELGKRLLERSPFLPNKKLAIQPKTPAQPTHSIVLFVPDHHPMLKSGICRFILHPVKNVNK
ncbi:hypothetical protein TNCT_93781 [Trichonephila clavata]|uniref:Uncharacterized protein n=1 Tax=Trichonephila clavata TaxID=2740835 RepID=A0A8X6FKN0_TRICU|nr:hypothetical protein TNCT_64661 [Trichonephila clavata]GFQ78743.1 hypothetical protein TNCT_350501 [Trichonephila clavata]GFQ82837.1 hypothetical protein TNCT_454321 [Trichonephila clavata]GFQ91787.1 hypothetical protein TNCT_485891 [Trichonephila clavata]GFQ91794.1 hypothetical protein TNCT_485921 [Trichonephila clavata]